MKKKKYLMKIFMHLHAPLKERIQMVKDLAVPAITLINHDLP